MNEYYTTRTHLKSAKEENSNGSSMEKNIFIDQLIKLALVNNIFTEHDVASELKTMLLAVSFSFCSNIFNFLTILISFYDLLLPFSFPF